jgi:hypothetical protein
MIAAGVESLELGRTFSQARRRILLYAPPYGNFAANSGIAQGLESALARQGGARLTAFSLPDPAYCHWAGELFRLLRPLAGPDDMTGELLASRRYLDGLKDAFGERVELVEMPFRPSLPVVIVDDRMFFGHFARSAVLAPEGFWCVADAPVEALLDCARAGRVPDGADRETRAAFRIAAECALALEQGGRLESNAPA